ncbi:MAG TPA: hypothetical protein VFG03_21330 [Telluria sp.]|nr:hypothetical protein [Telluria sp.]
MNDKTGPTQLDRELQRERQQRNLNDDTKLGARQPADGRLKDARETDDSSTLRRPRD